MTPSIQSRIDELFSAAVQKWQFKEGNTYNVGNFLTSGCVELQKDLLQLYKELATELIGEDAQTVPKSYVDAYKQDAEFALRKQQRQRLAEQLGTSDD